MTTILVTGASGFIGSKVVTEAARRGLEVIGMARSIPDSARNNKAIRYVEADLADYESLRLALVGTSIDHAVNLGGDIHHRRLADGGRNMIRSHFIGAMNLVQLCQHWDIEGFLQVGSSDEYGNHPAPQNESMRERPVSPYAAAKASATTLIQMLHRTEGFPGKVARPFLVYGPGQNDQRFIPQVVRGCLDNSSFPVSEGSQRRDFTYVDDVANGLLDLVLDPDCNGACLNIASGQSITIREMIEKIVSICGGGEPGFGEVAFRPGENMALVADMTSTFEALDWRPSVDLDEGLTRTVDWFRQRSG